MEEVARRRREEAEAKKKVLPLTVLYNGSLLLPAEGADEESLLFSSSDSEAESDSEADAESESESESGSKVGRERVGALNAGQAAESGGDGVLEENKESGWVNFANGAKEIEEEEEIVLKPPPNLVENNKQKEANLNAKDESKKKTKKKKKKKNNNKTSGLDPHPNALASTWLEVGEEEATGRAALVALAAKDNRVVIDVDEHGSALRGGGAVMNLGAKLRTDDSEKAKDRGKAPIGGSSVALSLFPEKDHREYKVKLQVREDATIEQMLGAFVQKLEKRKVTWQGTRKVPLSSQLILQSPTLHMVNHDSVFRGYLQNYGETLRFFVTDAASLTSNSLSTRLDVILRRQGLKGITKLLDGDDITDWDVTMAIRAGQVKAARLVVEALLEKNPARDDLKVILVRLGLKQERFKYAQESFDRCTQNFKESDKGIELGADLAFEMGNYEAAYKLYDGLYFWLVQRNDQEAVVRTQDGETKKVSRRNIIRVRKAKSMYKIGMKNQAIGEIQDTLMKEGDGDHNTEGLLLYGEILMERAYFEEGFKLYLRALTSTPRDEMMRKKVAEVMYEKPEKTVAIIDEVLSSTEEKPATDGFSYIAEVARDHGAFVAAEKVMELSIIRNPTSSRSNLFMIRVMELQGKYSEMLQLAADFLESCDSFDPMGLKPCIKDACRVAVDVVHDVLTHRVRKSATPGANLHIIQKYAFRLRLVENLDPNSHLPVPVVEHLRPRSIAAQHFDLLTEASYRAIDVEERGEYTDREIEIIGVILRICSRLFVMGPSYLRFLPPIISAVEYCRKGAELHLTSVRNEHAVYHVVVLLMPYLGHHVTAEAPRLPKDSVYLFGDSNILPASWHFGIRGKGKKRKKYIFVPKLSNGMRIKQMSLEAVYFGKQDFQSLLDSIPDGSRVVFFLGEFDCREGIPRDVDLDEFENVEDGIDSVTNLYILKLIQLARKRRFTVYVHPIPPVLDATRPTVNAFNKALKAKVIAHSKDLTWIEYLEDVFEEEEKGNFNQMKDEFHLDGTHINPNYVKFLEMSVDLNASSMPDIDETLQALEELDSSGK